ncbi:hypothetical protein ACFLVC_00400 [Chloroflexota bacterium]
MDKGIPAGDEVEKMEDWQKLIWLIVALLTVVLAIWLTRRARDFAWKWGRFERSENLLKKNNLAKKWIAAPSQWFYEHWGVVIIFGAILLLSSWTLVITLLFGERNAVSGIVVGSTISVFLLFQLPRLLSPHVQIVPLETTYTKLTNLDRPKDIKNLETCVDGQKKHVTAKEIPAIKVNEYRERFLHIANTGINTYENWSIHLLFDPAIKVDAEWLERRYKSSPNIQCATQRTDEKGATIIYSPRSGYSLGPNQDLIIGFNVAAKSKKAINPLRLEINSSNRWGDTVKYFSWQVEEQT